jgi:hypothetical protein
MNSLNRVLVRRGARSLSAEEMERVGGGLHTETVCTVPTNVCPNKDGDASIGECGPVC